MIINQQFNGIKVFFYCIIGTTLEWYDFALFGVLAPILSHVLFPAKSPVVANLITFSVFATGFIMRPFGGFFFGHIGDRYGRKKAVILSIFLMTLSTTLIGLLPTGGNLLLVIMLFVCLRLLQGISVGGEYPGIVTFIAEISPKQKTFLNLSFTCFGIFLGILLGEIIGNLSVSFFHTTHSSWYWLLPFLFSIFLGIIGLYLRLKAMESPIFITMKKENNIVKFPLKEVLINHWKKIALLFFISSPSGAAFYYVFSYFPSYLNTELNFSYHHFLNLGTLAIVVILICSLIIGLIATRKNANLLVLINLIAFVILPVPTIMLINIHPQSAAIVQAIYAIFIAVAMPILPGFIALLFPENIRFSGLALSSNTTVIIGGTCPLVSSLLIYLTHIKFAPSGYISLLAAIGVAVFFIAKKAGQLNMQPDRSLGKYQPVDDEN